MTDEIDSSSTSPELPSVDGIESIAGDVRQATGMAYSANQISRVRDLLTRLYAARRTARFYPMEHPATVDAISALKEVLDRFHAEGVDVPLAFFEGELIFGETLLPEHSIHFDQLIRDMTSIGVGSLTFDRGLTSAELSRAMALLSKDPEEAALGGGMAALAREADLPHVEIGEVKVFEKPSDQSTSDDDAKASYDGALDLMREIDALIRRNKVASSTHVKGVVRSLVDNVLGNRYAMLELTGLRSHDEYTFYHSANVAILSLALGAQITSDYRFLSSLGVGSLLHDIGKLTVDLRILNKPGALTPTEWGLIKQHPVYGAEQAALIPGLDKSAIVIILEHHMRYDGSGYPTRTPNRPQHLASRIVAVADAYDAMTSRRSYSAARVQDEAMSQLAQSAGTAHDPALVRAFVELMGVYPPRTVVRLDDGRTGIVLRPSVSDPLRPEVRIFADATGAMVDPFVEDLSQAQVGVSMCLNAADLNIEVDDYM